MSFSFSIRLECCEDEFCFFIPYFLVLFVSSRVHYIIRVRMIWPELGLEAPEVVLILSIFYLYSLLASRRSQNRKQISSFPVLLFQPLISSTFTNNHPLPPALDLLATLPSHQRHGAASALVKWGTDLADREGLPVFLEATAGNDGFYGKFGFEKVGEARHDLSKWGGQGWYTHVFMVREPVVVRG